MSADLHSVPAATHGRVLVRRARSRHARGVLAGFHGYSETAGIQLPRLEEIPGADAWTLVSVQALHRFYRGRTPEVGASWMTHEDRETAIADNVAYVNAALRLVADDAEAGIVYAGFSQGVSMAFRAAVRGAGRALGVIAIGGDVPPELVADPAARFPPIFLARGTADDWYTTPKFDNDMAALRARGADFETFVYEAPHEWTPAVSEAAGAWLGRLTGGSA